MKEEQKNRNGGIGAADRPDSESDNFSSGRRLPLKGQDLSSFIKVWLIEKEGQFFKSTLNTYDKAISDFLSYWNQQKRPGLDSLFIRQYERELTRFRKLAPATVQRNLSALRSFCSLYVKLSNVNSVARRKREPTAPCHTMTFRRLAPLS